MKSLILIGGTIFSVLTFVLISNSKPVDEGTLKKAESIIERYFDFQQERLLFDRAPASRSDISEKSKTLIKAVEKYFKNFPQGDTIKTKGKPSDASNDLSLGALALKENLKRPNDIKVSEVFSRAVENYRKGLQFKEFPADPAGNTFLEKAYEELRIVLASINIEETSSQAEKLKQLTLYMLGDIGTRLWQNKKDLAGILCLVETIRISEGEEIGKMAWISLNTFIHFGHSGSSGDHTPADWVSLLKDLEKIAQGYASMSISEKSTVLSTKQQIARLSNRK